LQFLPQETAWHLKLITHFLSRPIFILTYERLFS
jgi:hypothetical protein